MEDMEEPITHIGHLKPPEDLAYLNPAFFPSKLGGKPAWLDPLHLPTNIKCPKCDEIMTFLLQIYAASDLPHAFHRTLFVLACLPCKDQFKTLRCQLPRKNLFYSYHPLKDISLASSTSTYISSNGSDISADPAMFTNDFGLDIFTQKWQNQLDHTCCPHCGLPRGNGHNRCEIYQKHKTLLTKFQEHMIEIEDTYEIDEDDILPSMVDLSHEEQLFRKYHQETEANPGNVLDPSEEEAFEDISKENRYEDNNFTKFLSFINLYPEHILRYSRGGQPLWFSEQYIPDHIPNCDLCGGKRHFEFQIQPTLISKLSNHPEINVPDLEYGVVCIFSCSNDCEIPNSEDMYVEEYTYIQCDPFFK